MAEPSAYMAELEPKKVDLNLWQNNNEGTGSWIFNIILTEAPDRDGG